MQKCRKILFTLFVSLLLCACVKGDWTDLVSFCAHTKTPQREALRLTDCLVTHAEGELRCFWQGEDGVSLRVVCTEEGAVAQCRVLMQRMDAGGDVMPATEARVKAFCALSEQVCTALEEITPAQTDTLFETLRLREPETYRRAGSSALFRVPGLTARLINRNAETVLEISNRWLSPQSEKETPESVPAFDATTNIRTETVPLS